jgi:phosphatidyl-myo-inositol dimannoside synthase
MTERNDARVLIVTRNMPPLWGGMEQLNWHMAEELARRYLVRVVGPAGAADQSPANVEVFEVPLKPLVVFLFRALLVALNQVRNWRPEFVIAGSGLTAPIVWLVSRICGARAVVYLHGLDITVSHPFYRWIWIPVLRRMDRVIANSHATAQLAKQAGISPALIGVVYPGVTLPGEIIEPSKAAGFRSEHRLGSRPILLSVGRLTERKGLREFVTDVLPRIVAHYPDVILLIVGDIPINALRAKAQTQRSIELAAAEAGVAENLKFLGVITDRNTLATVYQAATIHIFPVRHILGDPEGFGMVAVEAAAYGLPTVSYATGGVVDALSDGISGYLLTPGDTTAFADAVLRLIEKPLCPDKIRAHAENFAWEHFGDAIAKQLSSVCV